MVGQGIQITDEKLRAAIFLRGSHGGPAQGHCAMEFVAHVSGERWSDSPDCVPRTLAAMARSLNDRMDDERRNNLEFKRAVIACAGADKSPEVERRRAFRSADYACREAAPIALELAIAVHEFRGRQDRAEALRGGLLKIRELAPVVDKATALVARDVLREAYAAADADAAAAYAAADAAAAAAAADADAAAAYAAYAAADAAAAYAAADAAAKSTSQQIKLQASEARERLWSGAIQLLAELAAMKSETSPDA